MQVISQTQYFHDLRIDLEILRKQHHHGCKTNQKRNRARHFRHYIEESFDITTGNRIKMEKIDIEFNNHQREEERDAIFIFLNLPECIQDFILNLISPTISNPMLHFHRRVEPIYDAETFQETKFCLNIEYHFHRGNNASFSDDSDDTVCFYENDDGNLTFYTSYFWDSWEACQRRIEVVSANCLRIKVIDHWEAVVTMTETGGIIYDYIQTDHVDIYPFEYTSWQKRLPGHRSLTYNSTKEEKTDAIKFNRQFSNDKNAYWDSDWFYHRMESYDLSIVGYWRHLRRDSEAVEDMYALIEDFEALCDDSLCGDYESIVTQTKYEAALQKKRDRIY